MLKVIYISFLFSFLEYNQAKKNADNQYHHLVIATNNKASAAYKVIGIKDGDTFVILANKNEQTIRLEHIDCPEKKQPFGNKAKQFAAALCFGQMVQLKHNNKYDRNKRLIAEIILANGLNVNKELVKNGLAWHFKKYSSNFEYATLEINARTKKIGIWSQPNPIAPWDFRKNIFIKTKEI